MKYFSLKLSEQSWNYNKEKDNMYRHSFIKVYWIQCSACFWSRARVAMNEKIKIVFVEIAKTSRKIESCLCFFKNGKQWDKKESLSKIVEIMISITLIKTSLKLPVKYLLHDVFFNDQLKPKVANKGTCTFPSPNLYHI